jgi:hypothetical protein
MVDYADFPGPQGGADNMGGTKQFFYYAPIDYFDTIEKPDPNDTSLEGKSIIPVSHTFQAGKGFHKMYCTIDKGNIEASQQGETDGHSYKQMAKYFYPGSDAAVHGLASRAKNDRFITLHEMPDGKVMQIGSEDFFAKISGKFGTGTNSSGIRGYEFEVASMAPDNYIYEGDITLFADEAGS